MNRSVLITIIVFITGARVLWMLDREMTFVHPRMATSCGDRREDGQESPISNVETKVADLEQYGAYEKLSVTPREWQDWLSTAMPSKGVKKFDPDISESGCGVTTKVGFNTTGRRVSAFFKYNDEEKSFLYHMDAETHYQEIKAAHFDKILQTNIVPPVVGYEFRTSEFLRADKSKRELKEHMTCKSKSNKFFRQTGMIRGSMMLWVDGITELQRNEIADAALHDDNHNAIRYAIFHYLAACGKTDHNHFGICMDDASDDCTDSDAAKFYVALDNDRCFQPKRVREYFPAYGYGGSQRYQWKYYDRLTIWKDVVYKTCAFPKDVVNIVLSTEKGELLSERLKESIQEDLLAEDILALHPESYAELDERVSKLAKHMKKCKKMRQTRTE